MIKWGGRWYDNNGTKSREREKVEWERK
jgi:hypothetical protein